MIEFDGAESGVMLSDGSQERIQVPKFRFSDSEGLERWELGQVLGDGRSDVS